jgi:hypothetical protein
MADYSQAWEKYRRRRNLFIVVALSIVPIWLLMQGLFAFVPHRDILSTSWGLLILGWFVVTIVRSNQAHYCPCPRCGKQFSSKGWYHRVMAFAGDVPIAGYRNLRTRMLSKVDLMLGPN